MSAHGWRGPVPNVCSKVRTYFFSNKFYEFKRNKKARYKKKLVKQIFLRIIFYCMHLTHHGQFHRMSKPTASLTIKLTTLKGQKL